MGIARRLRWKRRACRKKKLPRAWGCLSAGQKAAFSAGAADEGVREAARALGYSFERGRLDVSVHPFSISLGPGDSRITTRYHANRFSDAFFGVMHETGHALYEHLYDGDASLVNGELARYQAVTLADVRRVAAQYLVPANRIVLDVMPPPASTDSRGAAPRE